MGESISGDRRSVDADIRDLAEALFLRGWTPTQVLRRLEQLERFAGRRLPSRKTLQRWSNEISERDASDPFSLKDVAESLSAVEVAERIPDVLREVALQTSGRVVSLTRREAAFAAAARVLAPDLPPWRAYVVARICARRVELGQATTDVEQFLAFTPWRDKLASERYRLNYSGGVVHAPPTALLRDDADEVDLFAAGAASEFPAAEILREATLTHDFDLVRRAYALPEGEPPEYMAAKIASTFGLRPALLHPDDAARFVHDFYEALPEILPTGGPPEGEAEIAERVKETFARGRAWYSGWLAEQADAELRWREELEDGDGEAGE